MELRPSAELLNEIVDRVSVGILVVNKDYELVLWNSYMENYSQKKADEVIGVNIFKSFPDLPKAWLEQKIRNVFILKNFSFTSWEHRPYLFKFFHNRPITGGIDYMRQNCTFLPIKGDSGDIEFVCITLLDVTDTSIYEGMLKSAVKSLAESSNRDGLTNIYNRRYLEQSMSREFARIKRYGGTMSFVIIDLDHFKKINDNYGHLAGDEILKVAAKRIGECLRESDLLARYGGEEFAIMLPETPLEGGAILANRVCKHLAKDLVKFNEFEIHISASLGVAEFQPQLETHEQLISRADSVLYISKDNGRNQVTLFDHNNPTKHLQKQEGNTEQNQVLVEPITTSEPNTTSAALEKIVTSTEEAGAGNPEASPVKHAGMISKESESAPSSQLEPEVELANSTKVADTDGDYSNSKSTQTILRTEVKTETGEKLESANVNKQDTIDDTTNENNSSTSITVTSNSLENIETQKPSDIGEQNNFASEVDGKLPISDLDEPAKATESFSSSPTEQTSIEDEKELTVEEKADLAMIAAYSSALKDESLTAEIIDMSSTQHSSDNFEPAKTKSKHDTIYVKLGSK